MNRLRFALSSRFLAFSRVLPIARRLESSAAKPETPNGFLFNEPPIKAGEKRQKEPWENMWIIGMGLPFVLAVLGLYFKPDTNVSTWGHVEAMKELSKSPSEEENGDQVEEENDNE